MLIGIIMIWVAVITAATLSKKSNEDFRWMQILPLIIISGLISAEIIMSYIGRL